MITDHSLPQTLTLITATSRAQNLCPKIEFQIKTRLFCLIDFLIICLYQSMWESLLSEEGLEYKLSNSSQQQTQRLQRKQSSGAVHRKKAYQFPSRAFINILLILLTSFQVVMIVQSQVYLHCSLVRSFLNFYADNNIYPDLFSGNTFQLQIQNIQQLQAHINYVVKAINASSQQSFITMRYQDANISLDVQYRPRQESYKKNISYPIDPSIGIMEPFEAGNLTQLQEFLLDTRYFKIVVDNLIVENDGLYQTYVHRVVYRYYSGNYITVNYEFQISNALVSNIEIQRPQANFLIFLRIFYLIVLFLALLSFYFNATYIRKVVKQFYASLEAHAAPSAPSRPPQENSPGSLASSNNLTKDELKDIHDSIEVNIEVRHITINNLKWEDYVNVLDFDVLFSVISNSFQIIGNFYLLFGREHQIIVGIGCLFSWMTIFKILRNYKKLILMYQLIKMSIFRVTQFLVSFMIIFLGYTFLGMCVFPKVQHFASMDLAVTTLAAIMAGDSISDISCDMAEKNSKILVIIYIFSYVILFMHAIHNTLISILKEYFILKKIEILKMQKAKRGQEDVIYVQECPLASEHQLNQLRVKMTDKMHSERVLREKKARRKGIDKRIRKMLMVIENAISRQKWQAFDCDLYDTQFYKEQLQNRLKQILDIFNNIKRLQQEQMQERVSSEDYSPPLRAVRSQNEL